MAVQLAADVAELDQLGQLPLARGLRARRGSRAARARCTPCRAARRPPPRSRTRAWSRWSRRSRRTRDTWKPRFTASVRSASLCCFEPVKCWSRLPKFSGGTIRRSTATPLCVTARTPALARLLHLADQRHLRRTRRRARRGRSRWPRCRGPCRSRPSAARCPPPRPASAAGCSRSAATSELGDVARLREQDARLGPPVGAGVERVPDGLLGLLAEAAHRAQPPASTASRRSSSDSMPSSSNSLRAFFGPEPGHARDLHEPGRVLRLQLLRRRDRPGLEQRVDLLLDRLADARAAPSPCRRPSSSSTETVDSRIAFAALRYATTL